MTGAMLRRIREAYDLTLAQVAEMSGLSTSVIGGLESRGVLRPCLSIALS